jgi:hypothetical protein
MKNKAKSKRRGGENAEAVELRVGFLVVRRRKRGEER